jgi:hypothetical protein
MATLGGCQPVLLGGGDDLLHAGEIDPRGLDIVGHERSIEQLLIGVWTFKKFRLMPISIIF